MLDQSVDTILVTAPKQRNTNGEKADLRAGRILKDWQDDGTFPSTDLAIPFFGYKSHISIDRKLRLIWQWKVSDASASDGARLRKGLLDKTNTASTVWADTAYHSKADEDFMEK